ncbi:MAG: hypothetical protein H6737_07075 [Alphaproteobacteria bacterium]|nr:hypothetical protein [Alphaproteobacteria bacterium]
MHLNSTHLDAIDNEVSLSGGLAPEDVSVLEQAIAEGALGELILDIQGTALMLLDDDEAPAPVTRRAFDLDASLPPAVGEIAAPRALRPSEIATVPPLPVREAAPPPVRAVPSKPVDRPRSPRSPSNPPRSESRVWTAAVIASSALCAAAATLCVLSV